jgi:invasion protein IalB
MFGKFLALGAAMAIVSAVPAVAQQDDKPASKQKDPNQVVCEKVEELGTRLSAKKVCMTRSEWAERRRQDRMDIDRTQRGRGSCEGC